MVQTDQRAAADGIRERIRLLRQEIVDLEAELRDLEEPITSEEAQLPLRLSEYRRYGRQMMLPGFGLPSQLRLKKARILVVGAGGLGCPALLYLAGAGVGHITIVDHDKVELSNLHRQVLHAEETVGMYKADSARLAVRRCNQSVQVETITERLSLSMLGLDSDMPGLQISDVDLVIDCTDNPETRYLLSDACVLAGVPLVSGGAIGLEGWSSVWNLPMGDVRGPCMRCIYPRKRGENAANCEDEGVLGTVTGIIGTLMACSAIKLLIGTHEPEPSMTLYAPFTSPQFRNVRLRGRRAGCPGCSAPNAQYLLYEHSENAEISCSAIETDSDLRVSARELLQMLSRSNAKYALLDVRPEAEYSICSIPGSNNLPFAQITRSPAMVESALSDMAESEQIYVICRRGNDSLQVARQLRERHPDRNIHDIRGGITAWAAHEPGFPVY